MDTRVLEDIGLSRSEIKVFITILELGECKAGQIIKRSKLQSSSAYYAINILIQRGLVSYIKKSQVKFYRAADPATIVDYIDAKKNEFLKLLPELQARKNKNVDEGVEFFRSYKGIKTLLLNLLKDAKKGDIYRTFSLEDPEQYEKATERVYFAIKLIAKEKKVIMKGIFHENTRKKPSKDSYMKKRYVNFPLPPNNVTMNGKVAIISWDKQPTGILIHSIDMAQRYIDFFEHMWKASKK